MERAIIRGTTPTIKYTFDTVNVADISVAYLTGEQDDIHIEKGLSEATIGDGFLAWTLTQEETLAFASKMSRWMCNWKKTDGTRGASKTMGILFEDNQKPEVI